MPLPRRIESFDVLRGLCAIFVMLMHGEVLLGVNIAPSAYLAVDMFLLISGFVLAEAYEARLRRGGFASEFGRKRLIRLWPMWAVAAAGSAAMPLLLARHSGYGAWLVSALSGLLLVPLPRPGYLFPFNPPGWSLLCEGLANAAFAIGARISRPALWLVVALAAAGLIGAAISHGSLYGGQRAADLYVGLARTAYSFALGIALQRARLRSGASGRLAFVCATIALLGAFLISPPTTYRVAYDCLVVLIGCPTVMILALGVKLRSPTWSAWLGDLSYPLYAVHFPIMLAARSVRGLLTGWRAAPFPVSWTCGVFVGSLLLALWLGRRVDPVLRQRLDGLLAWSRAAPARGRCPGKPASADLAARLDSAKALP